MSHAVDESQTRDSVQSVLKALDKVATLDTMPTPDQRIRMLSRAALKGWIQYPLSTDNPVAVMERGHELARAIDTDDKATIKRLGVRSGK